MRATPDPSIGLTRSQAIVAGFGTQMGRSDRGRGAVLMGGRACPPPWGVRSLRWGVSGVADPDDVRVAQLYARARRAAAGVVGAGAAEDVASEAVVRALVRWGRVQGYAERWVVVVASNLAVDLLRRRRVPLVAAGVVRFEFEVIERVDVEGLLRRLPARQRQVVALRYLVGCSEAEVAEALEVSLETVRTHLKRARRELRSSITREVV